MYEGGIRVPGTDRVAKSNHQTAGQHVNAVTSDMLPTLCALTGCEVPNRPLDGINLEPLIDGQMTKRPSPICFWAFNTKSESGRPWIEPELQQGTTPLVKLMAGEPTRTFRNFDHAKVRQQDFDGSRAIICNRYKLIVGGKEGESKKNLFDLRGDSGETANLTEHKPEAVRELEGQLRQWQRSVMESLTGTDYR